MSHSSLPTTMKAITIHGKKAAVTSNVALPTLRPTYILAKVDSVALNPTDWKHIHYGIAGAGSVSGCDFSGTVVAIGSDVTKSLKVGDRIAATTHGANFSEVQDGCFAEYAVAKGDLVVKIPDELSFEQAATFPLGVSTVGQGLFQQALKMNLPTEPTKGGESVLIYGGSTATGSLAIQFAKLAGYHVLTTCSPHNTAFVTALGADAVYDYRDPACGTKINADTHDSLKLAWDTISLPASAAICAQALSSSGEGARYGGILEQHSFPRGDVATAFTFMYTIFDEGFTKGGGDVPAVRADFEFAKMFFGMTEGLLREGKLKTHPERVGAGGLEGMLQGMVEMKEGKVSGEKLVYRVRETPEGSKAEIEL